MAKLHISYFIVEHDNYIIISINLFINYSSPKNTAISTETTIYFLGLSLLTFHNFVLLDERIEIGERKALNATLLVGFVCL